MYNGYISSFREFFSVAGLIVTKTRNRLDAELVDEIIFLNKALHQKYKEEKATDVLNMKKEKEEGEAQASTSYSFSEEDAPMFPTVLY